VKRVILESPYRGDVAQNVAYAQDAAIDCLRRGESPFASHLYFTHFLRDDVPEERALGIAAGLAWRHGAEYAVFYVDLGWSSGMIDALGLYRHEGLPCEKRSLEAWR
jgi:hypothetical protein